VGKNIVFCADGTWNGPGDADGGDKTGDATNVFKLFLNLAGAAAPGTGPSAKEQEKTLAGGDGSTDQAAKYLHGVGDSDNVLVKALGGTLGAGLIARVVRGYTFVSRNYAAGDRIFLAGFSRGAYTARALAGLISAKGLLDAAKIDLTDKVRAYQLGAAAWYAYRRSRLQSDENWLGHLQEIVSDLPAFILIPPRDDQLVQAPIEAVAVWDTVGALGIPEYTKSMTRIDVFRFADARLSDAARHGVQAIAVDEQREDFTPTLWDADPRVLQALFPGSHSDVGGGYPASGGESGLSDCALQWMTDELSKLQVLFSPSPSVTPDPDAKGTAHQPWTKPPWDALPRGPRSFPPGLRLAQSVLDRARGGPVIPDPGSPAGPYTPGNLGDYMA